MPVDPQLKADLMLVRQTFEEKALEQDSQAATIVPVAGMLRNGRDAHQTLRDQVARYPSYYARNTDETQSTIDRIQQECVPCSARISALKECDLSPQIDDMLLVYDRNVLRQLVALFRNLNGRNPIEQHLCDVYKFYNAQCIPDLRRTIAALAYLINDIRSFKLKKLKDSFLQSLLALLAGLVVNITFNFEKFGLLVTDTVKCSLADIKAELAKLSPILSKEGRNQARESIRRSVRNTEEDKQWIRDMDLYAPAPPTHIPFNDELTAFEENILDKLPNRLGGFDTVLEKTVQAAISTIDQNIIGTRQELVKLLKQNGEDLSALHQLIEQALLVQGMINVIKGLADTKNDYDPCGDPNIDNIELARRFFTRAKLPNRRIDVVPDADNPGNVSIEITSDPMTVGNPVVQDILEDAGFPINGDQILPAEPMEVNLFGCLGRNIE
jgi:hypothetical protein